MKKEKKEYVSKVLGVLFILAGFALGAVYLFVETLKEIPETWIVGLILTGLLLVLAKKKLIELLDRFLGKKTER
ncbi:MAG TPA: hypothetical protein VFM82_05825 [Flavobacteriaceae bacterium]|nr:hypothetical protein [Flavobacteriaceae bacterium]